MSDSKVEIKIPEELIRGMVQGAVLAQLGNPVERAAEFIQGFLMQKCHRPGGPSYGEERPLLEWLFQGAVEKIAKEEMHSFLESQRDEIRAQIAKTLKGNLWGPKLAEALVNALSYNGRLDISVGLNMEVKRS